MSAVDDNWLRLLHMTSIGPLQQVIATGVKNDTTPIWMGQLCAIR